MITASVVLYNTDSEQFNMLLECVKKSEVVSKFFVIDNSPIKRREISQLWDKIEYIEHENTGYGSSHNIAIKKAIEFNAEYHIVLNPDIRFDCNVLSELQNYMDSNSDVNYILPKVLYPDGELQYLCKLLPTPSDLFFRRFIPSFGPLKKLKEKKNDRYTLKISGYNSIINPPCLSGCFMFMRCKSLQENNIFFDDSFFMYFEDFDLVRRLHRVGKTIFYPNVSIIHDHAKASYKSKRMLKIHIKSAFKYFKKYGWFLDKERSEMNEKILQEIRLLNTEEK